MQPVGRMLGAALLLMLGACATSPPPVGGASAAVPADFTLDVAVLSGSAVVPRPEAHLRTSRAVVFPDGSLHFAADEGLDANDLPGVTRLLSYQQVSEIWSMAQDLGFLSSHSTVAIQNPETIEAGEREYVYVISARFNDERWMRVMRFGESDVPPADAMKFIRHLSRLAWATDLPAESGEVEVRRYDFGPDPYARYRGGTVP